MKMIRHPMGVPFFRWKNKADMPVTFLLPVNRAYILILYAIGG